VQVSSDDEQQPSPQVSVQSAGQSQKSSEAEQQPSPQVSAQSVGQEQ
jgi:hypothetical protein